MRKIRQHNDIDIVVKLKNDKGAVLDPALIKEYKVFLTQLGYRLRIEDYQILPDGGIGFRFHAGEQRIGVYSIIVTAVTTDDRVFTTDVCNAFALVRCSCDAEDGSSDAEIEALEVDASFEITAWGGGESTDSTTSLSGKINLTSIDEIKAAQSALTLTNEVAFYLVTDSNGKIPSSRGCYDIPSANVKQLSLTSPNSITNGALALATSSVNINAVGVNVGDFVALTRVKVKVSDLTESIGINLNLSGEIEIYQYKILSMNDAKPTGHREASAGVMGLMSPWDKEQVNKIGGIESTANNALPKSSRFPSIPAWLVDVNTCFSVGVYPTCSSQLNSPFTNSTYFTCIVQSTSTADAGGFNTIEQTAYGIEGDTGLIYKRIIFKSSNDTQFGEWIKVSDGGAVPMYHAVILPSAEIVQIIDVSFPIGYSFIAVNEDVSEFYLAPSYFVDGSIIICNIDYTYKIDLDTDDESNLIGSIAVKLPTKSQVYATKIELNEKLGDINTILESIING